MESSSFCNHMSDRATVERKSARADPENPERGGRKMSEELESNIAPYPKHMTGILGPIQQYHSKDSWLKNSAPI